MSAEETAFAWRANTLPIAKLVLLSLADSSSYAEVVQRTGVRAQHVELLLRMLETQGLVVYDGERWSVALPPPLDPPQDSGYRKVPIPPELREAVFERDGHRCLACGVADRLTADHVIPEVLGGLTALDNLQTLCKPCNSRKGTRNDDYRRTATTG